MDYVTRYIIIKKECPEDWGRAIIVPIHKKGESMECSNYRALSLVNVTGKVYQSITTTIRKIRGRRDE